MDRPHVVVIGAGFGGLEVARHISGDFRVTVVDRNNFHTFQPLLYQVATSGLNAADVAHAVRGLFHGDPHVDFRHATVVGVDWDHRAVLLADQPSLPFDHLIVAAGSVTNFFGVSGAREHALPLYDLRDATRLRNRILERFEAAHVDPSEMDRGALCFTVVGGGPTGVEMAGALVELIDHVLAKDFPSLDLARVRVVLLEQLDRLLVPFTSSSQSHALETLTERGVQVRLRAAVSEIGADHVMLADGSRLDTQTVVWAAGVQANPLVSVLGVPQARAGRIAVADDLSVPGMPGVWAIGDIAHVEGDDGPLPQLAPVAMQSGRHVAEQIRRVESGRPTTAFRFRDKGTMATIGRRAAVAELPLGIRFQGGLAWLAWLALHLVFLVGRRNRLSVLLNWAWNYFTWDRGPRLIFGSDR